MVEGISRSSPEVRWHCLYVALFGGPSLGRIVRSRPRRGHIQRSAAIAASSGLGASSRCLPSQPGAGRRKRRKQKKEEKEEAQEKEIKLRTATETQVALTVKTSPSCSSDR